MTKRKQTLALGFFVLIAISSMSFIGCDAINAAATLKIPITVTVRPTGTDVNLPTTSVDCKDLGADSDFNDNKDRIKSGNVKEAFFQIERLDGPVFASGTIADQAFTTCTFALVFDPSYGDPKEYHLGTFTNVSLAALMADKMSIPLDTDIVTAINLIPSRPKFCFKATYGALNTGPATATFIGSRLEVVLDFQASAL